MRKNARTSEIHGTKREYDLGCRCDECRAANNASRKRVMARRRLGIVRQYHRRNKENTA